MRRTSARRENCPVTDSSETACAIHDSSFTCVQSVCVGERERERERARGREREREREREIER